MSLLSVLYVDDEEDLLTIGKLFLEREKEMVVDTALSGPKGLEMLEDTRYDAVISDYQMPGMNGIEFLVAMKKKHADIPFILFTGRGREEVVIQAINNGADFYIQKGGEPKSQFAELKHKVTLAAHHRQAERALFESELISRTLLEATLDAVAILDREQRILAVNETYADRFKKSVDDFPGMLVYDASDDPETWSVRREWISQVVATGRPVRFEDTRGDLFLENSVYPIFDRHGEIVKYAIYSRDITERKRSEERLITAYEKIARDEEELRESYDALVKKEEEVRESERRFRSFTENSPDGILLFKRDQTIEYANPIVATHTGLLLSDFVGKKCSDLGYSQDLARLWESTLKKTFHTGETGRIEYLLPSGIWVDLLVIPIRGENGEVSQVITSARDITEKKQSEEELKAAYEELLSSQEALKANYEALTRSEHALRDNERRLADIINFAPDATFAIDNESKVIAWNKAMAEMTGIPAEEILGRGDYEYALPLYNIRRPILIDLLFAENAEVEKNYLYIRREGKTLTAEMQYLREGKQVFLWGKASPLYDEQDHIVGGIESIRDITEIKRTEKELTDANYALRDHERRLADIINFAPDATLAIDRQGKVIAWNKAIADLTGIPAEEMLGKGDFEYAIPFYGSRRPILIDLITADDAEITDKYQHVRREGVYLTAETPYAHPAGREAILWVKASPLYDQDNTLVGGIESIRDVTEIKKVEQDLRNSQETFRKFLDNSYDAVFIHDEQGKILDVNATMLKMYMVSYEEALGYTIPDYSGSPDAAEKTAEFYRRVMNGENVYSPWRARRPKDGSLFDAEVFLTRIDTWAGPVILANVRDVTDIKRAEERARKKDELLQEITDALPGVVYQFYVTDDGEMGLSFVSGRAGEIFGISGDIATFFDQFRSHVIEEDREAFFQSSMHAVRSGEKWDFIGRYRKDSGEVLKFHGISEPMRVDDRVICNGFISILECASCP